MVTHKKLTFIFIFKIVELTDFIKGLKQSYLDFQKKHKHEGLISNEALK